MSTPAGPNFALVDLEGEFLRIINADPAAGAISFHTLSPGGAPLELAEAQGVQFVCPKCLRERGERPGCHMVLCWFRGRGVPDHLGPKPGRWTPAGSGLQDLSFAHGDPSAPNSVQLNGGCNAHFMVEGGRCREC